MSWNEGRWKKNVVFNIHSNMHVRKRKSDVCLVLWSRNQLWDRDWSLTDRFATVKASEQISFCRCFLLLFLIHGSQAQCPMLARHIDTKKTKINSLTKKSNNKSTFSQHSVLRVFCFYEINFFIDASHFPSSDKLLSS